MRNLLFILAVSIGITFSTFAQDVDISHPDSLWYEVQVPRLVFTEFCSQHFYEYIEITNMEDTAVNLGNYAIYNSINAKMYTRDANGYITSGIFDAATRYWGDGGTGRRFNFGADDVIDAHESVVLAVVYDECLNEFNLNRTQHMESFVEERCDYFVHALESGIRRPFVYNPAAQAWGKDSVSMIEGVAYASEALRACGPYELMYHYTRTDSLGDEVPYTILVDQLGLAEREDQGGSVSSDWSVAGTAQALVHYGYNSYVLVRKSSVTEPNLDWHDSRGTTASNSEWMVVPVPQGREPFSTAGNFGHYEMSITPKSEKVSIEGNTLTLPWEAKRFDDVVQNWLQLGEGMAFQYFKSGVSEDSAFVTAQNGDTLRLFVTGASLRSQDFIINVTGPTDDVAEVFPKIAKNYTTGAYANNASIIVTDNDPVIDTIMNVPFQQIIDTFLFDIDYPASASIQIVPVDGDANRTEITNGDILKVTSADGSNVKEYYIKPNAYEPSEDATLATLAFPEYELDPDEYYWEWESPELPGFGAENTFMVLKVSANRSSVPALFAMPNSRNATIKVDRAKNLTGSEEERTTKFTVTSESGTIEKVYRVRFDKDINLSLIQPIEGAEPFISQGLRQPGGSRAQDNYVAIFNPNSVPLDLSNYMLCSWNTKSGTVEGTIQSSVGSDTIPSNNDCKYYIPGYKYDLSRWKAAEPGYFVQDANVTPVVQANSEFVIGAFSTDPRNPQGEGTFADIVDVNLADSLIGDDFTLNEYSPGQFAANATKFGNNLLKHGTNSGYLLLKILNDSIKNGTKIRMDVADFEVVDMIRRPSEEDSLYQFYQDYAGQQTMAFSGWFNQSAADELGVDMMLGTINYSSRVRLRRKSFVQKGATAYGEGWHWHPDSCQWIWEKGAWSANAVWNSEKQEAELIRVDEIRETLKTHYMNPITWHLSTVSSSIYKVSSGFSDEHNLQIKGVEGNPTKLEFLANINKADPAQTLKIYRLGNELTDDNVILVDGDILSVQSADLTNTSTYNIVAGSLNGDVTLSEVAGMNIIVDGDVVTGFGYDARILDVLAGVECNPLSIINVVMDDTVPVTLLNVRYDQEIDSTMEVPTATYQYVESFVFDGLQFEVVAENGARKLYTLQPIQPMDDIFITSNFYDVVEGEIRYITSIPGGTAVSAMLSYLYAPGNAEIKLFNSAGYERTEGRPKWNDYVQVTSADGTLSAKYYLIFVGDDEAEKVGTFSGVDNVMAGSLVHLYPNPATDIVNLENVPANSVIQIISLSGSMVYNSSQVSERMTISTANFDRGLYFVRIVEKEGSSVLKMLVR